MLELLLNVTCICSTTDRPTAALEPLRRPIQVVVAVAAVATPAGDNLLLVDPVTAMAKGVATIIGHDPPTLTAITWRPPEAEGPKAVRIAQVG